MGELSIRLHSQFAILIMTMKTPEDFRTLWTERFERNYLNALYRTNALRTKQNALGTERNVLRTKRNVLVTERNVLRTERF